MANEISVTGNKKLKTLYKEFNKNFPYISLCVFPLSEKGKSSQSPHNSEMRISEVRTKTSPGDISIHGRTHAGNLEDNFGKIFGLYSQVCYNTGGGYYYTTGAKDKMSLSQLSKLGEKEGWKKKDT